MPPIYYSIQGRLIQLFDSLSELEINADGDATHMKDATGDNYYHSQF